MVELVRQVKKNLCTLLCLAVFLVSLGVAARPAKARTVRVGYYPVVNFQEYDAAAGSFRGYGYEYLMALAPYVDWQLNFIPLSYDKALEKLGNGDVDLMLHVARAGNPKAGGSRDLALDYYANPYESSPTCLVANPVRHDLNYGDTQVIDVLTVGLVEGDERNQDFLEYCAAHNYQPQLRYFATYAEVEHALQQNTVDAFLVCNLEAGSYRVVCELGAKQEYFAVTRGNSKLLSELRLALAALHEDDSSIEHNLYQKYYRSLNNSKLLFTSEETKYLQGHPVITVSYDPSWQPLSYTNEQGRFAGALAKFYGKLGELTGLRFNFVPSDSLVGAFANFSNGKTQLMAELPHDYTWAAQKQARLTLPFMRVVVVAAYKPGGAANNVVAMPQGFYQEYLSRTVMQNNFTFQHYENLEACIKAVLNNQAQYVMLNTYQLEYYRSRAAYKDLAFKVIPNMDYYLSIGVSQAADPRLISIMNKALQAVGSETVDEILRETSVTAESRSLLDVLYANTNVAWAVFTLLGMLLTILVGGSFYFWRMRQKNRQIAAATQAKEQFFANISHDMRTPLNGVIGYTELALHSSSQETIHSYLQKVQVTGQLLLQLVNDTLDISKLENKKMVLQQQPFLNRDLCDNVQTLISPLAVAKQLNFVVARKPAYEGWVCGDILRLQQLLVNLLSNAVKFTKAGGRVELLFAETPGEKQVAYQIVVRDNGIGMSKEFLPKLYDAYAQEQRTSSSQAVGTGLGMAIVRELVQLLQGTIQVESTLGEGTTFTINFALPKGQAPAAIGQAAGVQQQKLQKLQDKQVLLCEDHPVNAEIAKVVLSQWGLKVTWAKQGQEGVDVFRASPPGSYALILMDMHMPVLDGLGATKAIRALPRADAATVPIVAMTGEVDEKSVQSCRAAGMNAYLAKPLDKKMLWQVLLEQLP